MNLRDRSSSYCFLNKRSFWSKDWHPRRKTVKETFGGMPCCAGWPWRSAKLRNRFAMKARDIRELGPVWLEGGVQSLAVHTNPIKRPAATIPNHNRIETKPETFAFMGKRTPSSQLVTSR